MRQFNPKKELYKIQHGNKNKIIIFVFLLLIVGVMGYSFALYQVRYSKRIIYTKVAPFNNRDIQLAVYIDDKNVPSVPEKGSNYVFSDVECDNLNDNDIIVWDSEKWHLISSISVPNKCKIYFISKENLVVKDFELKSSYEEYIIPKTGTYKIELWGASGGLINGGKGAYTKGNIVLEENQPLYFYVGGMGVGNYMGNAATTYAGGYNGGGSILSISSSFIYQYDWHVSAGGGATDVRLTSGTWNDFTSLKSRIMVAAGGGGGAIQYNKYYAGGAGGTTEGKNGVSVYGVADGFGLGATQTSPGYSIYLPDNKYSSGSFGQGGNITNAVVDAAGGGGYYGGGGSYAIVNKVDGTGGGGSSFISGNSECNAINNTESTSINNIVHTGQPSHYSGKVFTNSIMISGDDLMPNYNGGVMIGNYGDGHARITLIK